MAERETERQEIETKLLELVAEYHRVLRRQVVAAREEVWGRYRYAETARRDLEEARAQASELQGKIEEISEKIERARSQGDELAEADLKVEHARVEEELASTEGLVKAAETVLARPEFTFRDRDECNEVVSGFALDAAQESRRLRQSLFEAFERREREIQEAAQEPGTESTRS